MSRCHLFSKYQIIIYPDCAGKCRALRLRRIVPRLMMGLILGMLLSGGFLLSRALQLGDMERSYADMESERIALRTGLLARARQLAGLRAEYDHVNDFIGKLKVMLSMEEPEPEGVAMGGIHYAFAQGSITPYNMRSLVRNMQRGADSLAGDVLDAEGEQQNVLREMRLNMNTLAWTPSVWPVKGRITSGFGMRNHPFDKTSRMHQGIDIVPTTGRGTPIHAPANGVVEFVGRKGYYGLTLNIRHTGNVMTRYAHLQKVAVKVGQVVSRDDVIAYVGNTGRSTGPHLHYEVRLDGKAVNPKRFILN
jgi:hypothetical protein